MKNYTFEITEKWSIQKTFTASSPQEAYDMAQAFQDSYDIAPDILDDQATYQGSHIELNENFLGEE